MFTAERQKEEEGGGEEGREEREMLIIAGYLRFLQSRTPARGMVLPVFSMCLSASVKLL